MLSLFIGVVIQRVRCAERNWEALEILVLSLAPAVGNFRTGWA
ncbi:MAG: hypothetical protein ACLVJ6_12355 [Merdibacter sp.]